MATIRAWKENLNSFTKEELIKFYLALTVLKDWSMLDSEFELYRIRPLIADELIIRQDREVS